MAPRLFHSVSQPSWPDCPTWHVVGTRELARLLGVGVQVLCDWRQRGIGPEPVPEGIYRRGPGGRRLYRISEVRRWYDSINGIIRETWMYDADFLKQFLRTKQNLTESQVRDLREMDWGDMLPRFSQPRRIIR